MIDVNKRLVEVNEVLLHLPEKEMAKIPEEVILNIWNKMDKEYKYKLLKDVDFEKQIMMRETKVLLAIIYRDFWATEYECDRINKKVNYDVQKYEENKKQEYNSEDIFKRKQQRVQENVNLPIVLEKRNFFVKLIDYIKNKFLNNVINKEE